MRRGGWRRPTWCASRARRPNGREQGHHHGRRDGATEEHALHAARAGQCRSRAFPLGIVCCGRVADEGPQRFQILFPSWFVGRDPDLMAHAEALFRKGPMEPVDLYGASFWMRMR